MPGQIEGFDSRSHCLVHVNTLGRDLADCRPPVMLRYAPSATPPTPVTTSGVAAGTALRAPRNVRWEATHDSVTITWDAPDESAHGSGPHTGFTITRHAVDESGTIQGDKSPSGTVSLGKDERSFSESGLISGQRYRYRVLAEGNDNAIPAEMFFTTSTAPPRPEPGVVTVINDGSKLLMFSEEELSLSEGERQSYTVRLATEPESDVTVSLSVGGEGVEVTPGSLEFNKQKKWHAPQTVTVRGADDDISNSDRSATITHEASGYGCYDGVSGNVRVRVTDDDGVVVTTDSLTPEQETTDRTTETQEETTQDSGAPGGGGGGGSSGGGGGGSGGGGGGSSGGGGGSSGGGGFPSAGGESQEVCSASGVTDDESLTEFVECAAEEIATSDSSDKTESLLNGFRDETGDWNDGSTYLVILTKTGEVYFHAAHRELEGNDWSGFVFCEGGESVLDRQEGCFIGYEGERRGYAHPFSASYVPMARGEEEFVLLGGFDKTPDGESSTEETGGGGGGCTVGGSGSGSVFGLLLAALALFLAASPRIRTVLR